MKFGLTKMLWAGSLILLCLANCEATEVENFLRAQSDVAARYDLIPTHILAEIKHCRDRSAIRQATVYQCILAVEGRDPEGALKKRLEKLSDREKLLSQDEEKLLEQIKAQLTSEESLYLFSYRRDPEAVREEGYLTLKNGTIVHRWPF